MFGYYLDLAVRSLKRNKVLTALMVIAIAVGIGASMTVNVVMLAPMIRCRVRVACCSIRRWMRIRPTTIATPIPST
jgi:hypothetical protein